MTLQERFEDKWFINVYNGCFEWFGALTANGYGKAWDSKLKLAHRVAYELYKGPIPDGMNVLHSCDNRKCVNLAHLRLGTHGDNVQDMIQKARHTHKLTPEQIEQIETTPWKRGVGAKLAKAFNVSRQCVSRHFHNAQRMHSRRKAVETTHARQAAQAF